MRINICKHDAGCERILEDLPVKLLLHEELQKRLCTLDLEDNGDLLCNYLPSMKHELDSSLNMELLMMIELEECEGCILLMMIDFRSD